MNIIRKVALAVFKDKKILQVRTDKQKLDDLSIIAQRKIFPWLKEHGYIK